MLGRFTRFTFAVVLLAAPIVSLAATAADTLADKLSHYQSMSADFVQYTVNEGRTRQQRTSGHFIISKPNLFRWITEPPMEQTIVGDGESIWIYDPDLEQVTRKPDSLQNGNSAPALILNGQVKQLKTRYNIEQPQTDDGLQMFRLTPKNGDDNFSEILLQFSSSHIVRLMMTDSLGQQTVMQFNHVKINPKTSKGDFSFTPPKGVDVMVEAGNN